jgi:hypothetical protein
MSAECISSSVYFSLASHTRVLVVGDVEIGPDFFQDSFESEGLKGTGFKTDSLSL